MTWRGRASHGSGWGCSASSPGRRAGRRPGGAAGAGTARRPLLRRRGATWPVSTRCARASTGRSLAALAAAIGEHGGLVFLSGDGGLAEGRQLLGRPVQSSRCRRPDLPAAPRSGASARRAHLPSRRVGRTTGRPIPAAGGAGSRPRSSWPRSRVTAPPRRRPGRPVRGLPQAKRSRSLGDLARQGRRPGHGWDDLVLPDDRLGPAARDLRPGPPPPPGARATGASARKLGRGRGLSALFTGPPGTGKTMAAEVLAGDARPGPVPDRPVRRGQQVHRRDREEPGADLRRGRAAATRSCSSTRRTRCSASAPR